MLEPSEHGTGLRFDVHGRPDGIMRILQPLLRRTLKRQFNQYCDTLKRLLEEEPEETAAASPTREGEAPPRG
jgi:hypothetical protein